MDKTACFGTHKPNRSRVTLPDNHHVCVTRGMVEHSREGTQDYVSGIIAEIDRGCQPPTGAGAYTNAVLPALVEVSARHDH